MNASRFMRKGEAARRKPVTFDFLADDGLLLLKEEHNNCCVRANSE